MKYITIIITIFLFNPNILFGQNKIEGFWATDIEAMYQANSNETKIRIDSLDEDTKNKAQESLGNRIYQFLPNGKVIAEWTFQNEEYEITGRYSLDTDENLQIEISEIILDYKLVFLTKTKIKLIPQWDNHDSFFDFLILTKSTDE
ncbi:hypothetical protein [Mangrovivirga cuniculi]|uniref:Lipocalin-like domain-containing protein n=1 Tax=Mangrovivirga cuniculi TaxID=2715131 RepID=A0A4D7K2W5_9BACT|nr:hypothetical protein [Mangrovivirga cuniculi]QCK15214.1 hypothetical protein DCC35_10890 [Mangrovivirga cuniculi]